MCPPCSHNNRHKVLNIFDAQFRTCLFVAHTPHLISFALQFLQVTKDGKIEARPMMYLALTYDHRLIDGREAVTFLVSIKNKIEDPGRLLLSI